jgi:hypothetical protein
MTTRVRCFCDVCGTEMVAERLRPVYTIQRITGEPLWLTQGHSDQQPPQWRSVKLGDACGACLERVTRQFGAAPHELDPGIVDRILGGMDA